MFASQNSSNTDTSTCSKAATCSGSDSCVPVQHIGLGAKAGMQKQNLLQLKAAGETWQTQGLAPAPHMLGADGKVSIPSKWGNMLRSRAAAENTQEDEPASGQ